MNYSYYVVSLKNKGTVSFYYFFRIVKLCMTFLPPLSTASIPILVVHAEDVLNASPGSTVSFLVFSFDLSAEYRWVRSDGISLSDSRFSGVNLGNLVISDVRPSDAGTYMCIVSNPAGSVISSARLTLSELRILCVLCLAKSYEHRKHSIMRHDRIY